MDDFRDPAVFFPTRHPLLFLAWGFFQVLFLEACGPDTAAKEAAGPAKNIRPAMRTIMTGNNFFMAIQFCEFIICGNLPGRKSHKITFSSIFLICQAH
jgi:hypothetical protein